MAENTVTQPKSGPEKKNLVMGIIRAIVNVSTGGQKEAWTQIESVAGLIIDLVTPFMFPKVIVAT